MNKPKVERVRRSCRRELLNLDDLIGTHSLEEFISLISFSDNKDIQVEMDWDGNEDGVYISIFKDEYLETEQEWKDRVESEEKALREWIEADKLSMKELAEKRRLETIDKLEEHLRVLKGGLK